MEIGQQISLDFRAPIAGYVDSMSSSLYNKLACLPGRGGERERGLGQRLTRDALNLAREYGVKALYLLTETAAGFFSRSGFKLIERLASARRADFNSVH